MPVNVNFPLPRCSSSLAPFCSMNNCNTHACIVSALSHRSRLPNKLSTDRNADKLRCFWVLRTNKYTVMKNRRIEKIMPHFIGKFLLNTYTGSIKTPTATGIKAQIQLFRLLEFSFAVSLFFSKCNFIFYATGRISQNTPIKRAGTYIRPPIGVTPSECFISCKMCSDKISLKLGMFHR